VDDFVKIAQCTQSKV